MAAWSSSLLSVFQKTDTSYQNQLVAKVGIITATPLLERQFDLARKRKVALFYDNWSLDSLKASIESNPAFSKVINDQIIMKILKSVEALHPLALNNFDSILISYSSNPILLLVNSTHIDFDKPDAKLQKLITKIEIDGELSPVVKKTLLERITEDIEATGTDKLHVYFSQLDAYSFTVDVNYHLNGDFETRQNWLTFITVGIAIIGALAIGTRFTR